MAGLIAIAVLGVLLLRTFDARVAPALDGLDLSISARMAIDRELPKLAGADISESMQPSARAAAMRAIDEAFVSAFSLVMVTTAALALGAARAGVMVRETADRSNENPRRSGRVLASANLLPMGYLRAERVRKVDEI